MSQNTNKPLSDNPTWQAIGAYAEAKEEIARLTAENERLRSASFVTAVPSEEYERLTAENERLRKAGDAMAERIDADGQPHLETDDWNDAKEGGDAK